MKKVFLILGEKGQFLDVGGIFKINGWQKHTAQNKASLTEKKKDGGK